MAPLDTPSHTDYSTDTDHENSRCKGVPTSFSFVSFCLHIVYSNLGPPPLPSSNTSIRICSFLRVVVVRHHPPAPPHGTHHPQIRARTLVFKCLCMIQQQAQRCACNCSFFLSLTMMWQPGEGLYPSLRTFNTTTIHHPRTRVRTLVFESGFPLPPPPSNHHHPPPSDTSAHARFRGWFPFATHHLPPPSNHHLPPPSNTSMYTDFRGCPSNHHHPPPSDMSAHARFRGWFLFATHLATTTFHHPRTRVRTLVFEGV